MAPPRTVSTDPGDDAPPIHPLVRKSRLSTLNDLQRILTAAIAVGLLLWVGEVLRRGAFEGTPFRLDLPAFVWIILVMLLAINGVAVAFFYIKYRHQVDERSQMMTIERDLGVAKSYVTVGVILLILFAAPPIVEGLNGLLVIDDPQVIESSLVYRFSAGDPLGLTRADDLQVTVETAGSANITFYDQAERERNHDQAHPYYPTRSATPTGSYRQAEELPDGEYAVVTDNLGEENIEVTYHVNRFLDPAFLTHLSAFALGLVLLNAANLVGLYRMRTKTIASFVERERARLRKRYTIEEILVIYQDGRLISHNSRTLKPDVDREIFTGMLTAVQSFVKESFNRDDPEGELNQMAYGKKTILLENGPQVTLAVVVDGQAPEHFRSRIRKVVEKIHVTYPRVLQSWSGDLAAFQGVKDLVATLVPPATNSNGLEEVFLIHRDHRFICHSTQRWGPDVDTKLLENTYRYIKGEIIAAQRGGGNIFSDLPYGPWRIVLGYGPSAYMAVLVSKNEVPPWLETSIAAALDQVHQSYGPQLSAWNGAVEELREIPRILEGVFMEPPTKQKGRFSRSR